MPTYKVGQAPWEIEEKKKPQSFEVGKAPWEVENSQPIIPVEEEQGLFKSIVQGVARPFLKVASTGRAIVDTAMSGGTQSEIDAINQKEYDYGYLGKVAALKNPLDSIGTGAEIGSWVIPGGGAAKVVKTGLKGQVIRGVAQGVKYGASGGATIGFGQALQEAEVKPADVAIRTLFGGAIGGATGGVLGGITPVVVKGVNTTKKFTDINQINTELKNLNTQVFKPTPKQLEKWSTKGKDPMKTYTEIFGAEVPQVGTDNRFTRESISEMVERVDDIYKPAAEGFNTILRNSPEVNSISKARDMAIENLDNFNLTPSMKTKAIQKIDDEFIAIKNEAAQAGKLLGEDSIPVSYTDNLKDRFWAATKNFGTDDATISNSVNSSIGHGFKESIEKSINDIDVKNYNKQLGDLITLRDFLETKAGAQAGTGGRMTRLMTRVAGSVAGSQGGPFGTVVGMLTGDKLAQILINPKYQPYRWLINKKLQQLPPAEIKRISDEANQIIEGMLQKRMGRLALPEGAKVGTSRNPLITPNTQGTPNQVISGEKSAVAISSENQAPLMRSERIDPTTNPTNIVKTNPINQAPLIKSQSTQPTINTTTKVNTPIEPNITTTPKKVNPNNPQSAFGGIAGIEIKKDENGRTVVRFNPEKAIAGVLGVASFKKISPKIKKEATDVMYLFKGFKASDFVNKGKLNLEAFNTVEELFEKSAKGTVTKADIKAAEEVHYLLKGNKEK